MSQVRTKESRESFAEGLSVAMANAEEKARKARKLATVAVTQPGSELTDEEIRERLEGPGFRRQFKARLDSITKKFRAIGSK